MEIQLYENKTPNNIPRWRLEADSEVVELQVQDVEEEGALEIAEVGANPCRTRCSQNLTHGVPQAGETTNRAMDRQRKC